MALQQDCDILKTALEKEESCRLSWDVESLVRRLLQQCKKGMCVWIQVTSGKGKESVSQSLEEKACGHRHQRSRW